MEPISAVPSRVPTERELRRQMPPLQTTTLSRQSTLKSRPKGPSQAPTAESIPDSAMIRPPQSPNGYLRFVLTDPVAARYIEEEPSTTVTVMARRQPIEGYELYLVEQWACSRSMPTFLITTYTGNPDDVVLATIISIPADERKWTPRMRLLSSSMSEYHAKRKETPYGYLNITNLSAFPSSLTVIPVPDGDIKKYREVFFVNEDLKRLGCSGRLGIKLAPPSGATQAKFHQLYRTSEKIPFNASVIELVKLCQVALVLFGKLEPEYCDGLLCDVTEKAVNDWWIEFGAEYYTVEPHDGILGPTTVAGLLGMLMGARNRLAACNSAIAKDVFDVESTKKSIYNFQKSQHLPRTRRLDRVTLESLRRTTAKAASKEGWAVPRAFKSTVAELGGKGGEMVMGIVGAGQKDGIAEVETVNIEQFAELVRGEHAKWLWHGKARKARENDMFERLATEDPTASPDKNDLGSFKPIKRESTLESHKLLKRETTNDELRRVESLPPERSINDKEKDSYSKRAAIKAKIESGNKFNHIKNAVGLRTYASKLSREEYGRGNSHLNRSDLKLPAHMENDGSIGLGHEQGHHSDDNLVAQRKSTEIEPSLAKVSTRTPPDSGSSLASRRVVKHENSALRSSVAESDTSTQPPLAGESVAGSIYHGVDLNKKLHVDQVNEVPALLRRTHSSDQLGCYHRAGNDDWWPRHLSFSSAEESVLRWNSVSMWELEDEAVDDQEVTIASLKARMAQVKMKSEQMKNLYRKLALLSNTESSWVSTRLHDMEELEASADKDLDTLDSIYYPKLDNYHNLREDTHTVVAKNRSQLLTSVRELSNMSDKLEYEISALRGKVEDVEDVLTEFERQVEYVESRTGELESTLGERETWSHWFCRMALGFGNRP